MIYILFKVEVNGDLHSAAAADFARFSRVVPTRPDVVV